MNKITYIMLAGVMAMIAACSATDTKGGNADEQCVTRCSVAEYVATNSPDCSRTVVTCVPNELSITWDDGGPDDTNHLFDCKNAILTAYTAAHLCQ